MTKSRFNEIKVVITKANRNKLETSIKKRKIAPKNAEELLEVLISGEIGKKNATKMYNSIADDANKSGNLKKQSLEKKCLKFLSSWMKFLGSLRQKKMKKIMNWLMKNQTQQICPI